MTTDKVSQGLDYYKATMGQLEFQTNPNAEVTFTLKNRADKPLSEYVTPRELSDRLEALRSGWDPDEIAYLAGLQNQDGNTQFDQAYLDFLADNQLPEVTVGYDDEGDLAVETTGPWPLVTFWETVIMSELNELYFTNKLEAEGTSLDEVYAEGDRRLSEKIELLKTRPDIKFADFGTRRRFSYGWHKHVVERLATELPENFIGTSNIYLAHELDVPPIGTFAHELPMVYAALEEAEGGNPLDGHGKLMRDWETAYRGDLSTALTDTFSSEFFFADFTAEQARAWKSLRHDSGDPFEFGERVIEFFQKYDIDPQEKTIVFSDGLDIDMIVRLTDYFKDRIDVVFGWGTTLTNDLGIKANNFVIKATEVNGISTVKLSDNEGKHTGSPEDIARYKQHVAQRIAHTAVESQLVSA
jgi:nicotinate phosphoribosyltransferase